MFPKTKATRFYTKGKRSYFRCFKELRLHIKRVASPIVMKRVASPIESNFNEKGSVPY
jgi:hypothetical protein